MAISRKFSCNLVVILIVILRKSHIILNFIHAPRGAYCFLMLFDDRVVKTLCAVDPIGSRIRVPLVLPLFVLEQCVYSIASYYTGAQIGTRFSSAGCVIVKP